MAYFNRAPTMPSTPRGRLAFLKHVEELSRIIQAVFDDLRCNVDHDCSSATGVYPDFAGLVTYFSWVGNVEWIDYMADGECRQRHDEIWWADEKFFLRLWVWFRDWTEWHNIEERDARGRSSALLVRAERGNPHAWGTHMRGKFWMQRVLSESRNTRRKQAT
eukprot:GEMP01109789.1.p1 GENE.GEMP01109789.1~~GEMP01109789.1.p1  ORF type:complete len:162 (+),score=32.89 GEMP01109789.1:123-608(+)